MKIPLVSILTLSMTAAHAATFGSSANEFTMDFVTIGNTGNADDVSGHGGVDYIFRMSTYEVSRGMIDSYNALGGGPAITMFDAKSYGGNGTDRPATGVGWNEAARFVNWLNTSSGYSAAYKFVTGGVLDNIALWEPGDSGYDANNLFRNRNAHYFLPSLDEWYKAAYYDPNANGGLGVYWAYATGSNSEPTPVASGTTPRTAVYNGQEGPATITNAGGLSPYGTMAQNGNVFEWVESSLVAPNDSPREFRVTRGGNWIGLSTPLRSSVGGFGTPESEGGNIGFRVAAVPEPSGALFVLVGLFGLSLTHRR